MDKFTREQLAKSDEVIARAVNCHEELVNELKEILEYAKIEKSPLRQQEIRSIEKIITKAEGK